MARSYCAFLLRCWRLDDGAQRIEVAHIQSGERTVLASLTAALAWIDARSGVSADGPPATRNLANPRRRPRRQGQLTTGVHQGRTVRGSRNAGGRRTAVQTSARRRA